LPEKSVGGQTDAAETAAVHAGMLNLSALSRRVLIRTSQRESSRKNC
jgi:hypothetical protein